MVGGVPVILIGEEEINLSSLTVARGELVIAEVDTVIIMSLAFDSSDDAADEEVNGGDAPCLFGEDDGVMWLSTIVPPLLITDTEDDEVEIHVVGCPPIETGEDGEGSSLTLMTSICSTEARSLDSDDCLL